MDKVSKAIKTTSIFLYEKKKGERYRRKRHVVHGKIILTWVNMERNSINYLSQAIRQSCRPIYSLATQPLHKDEYRPKIRQYDYLESFLLEAAKMSIYPRFNTKPASIVAIPYASLPRDLWNKYNGTKKIYDAHELIDMFIGQLEPSNFDYYHASYNETWEKLVLFQPDLINFCKI